MAFKFGQVVFPIPAATTNASILRAADPALAKILDFLEYMITTYVGDALVSYAAIAATAAPIANAVEQVAPINPDVIAKAEQWRFPGLFGWREKAKDNERTIDWRQSVTTVFIAYILPPLSPSQRVKLEPVLAAIGKIVNYAFAIGFDAGYLSGQRVISENDISRVRLMSEEFGTYKFDDAKESYFPSWLGELEVTEQMEPYTVGLDDLTGADIKITQQDDDGNTLVVTGTVPAPAVTITGPLPLPPELRLEIQIGGPRGTATFRLSLDAGATFIATGVLTAATYTIPTTSFVLHFPVGTYASDNVYVSTPVTVLRFATDIPP